MKQLIENSMLFGTNAPFIEELYEDYLQNPTLVLPEWRSYFDELQKIPGKTTRDVPHGPVLESFIRPAKEHACGDQAAVQGAVQAVAAERKQVSVLQIINAHRFLGVRLANLDPLKHQEKPYIPELDPSHYGLTEADLDTVFDTGSLVGPARSSLREILQALRQIYCGSIGIEYMYIADTEQKRWIQKRFEGPRAQPAYSAEYKRHILERLNAAEGLEKYLHTRYVGQKRFSGEGGESLIPLLDNLLQRAGQMGICKEKKKIPFQQ